MKATIRLDRVVFSTDSDADAWGLLPDWDGVAVYAIDDAQPGMPDRMHQPFRRGTHGKDAHGRNVWGWDGDREAPTLTPSFLCQPPRVHLFLRAGRIDLCGDSEVQVKEANKR